MVIKKMRRESGRPECTRQVENASGVSKLAATIDPKNQAGSYASLSKWWTAAAGKRKFNVALKLAKKCKNISNFQQMLMDKIEQLESEEHVYYRNKIFFNDLIELGQLGLVFKQSLEE